MQSPRVSTSKRNKDGYSLSNINLESVERLIWSIRWFLFDSAVFSSILAENWFDAFAGGNWLFGNGDKLLAYIKYKEEMRDVRLIWGLEDCMLDFSACSY